MDQIVYVVQPEGDKFVLYRERRYDDGRKPRTFIESFVSRSLAESTCEQLNRET